MADLTHVYHAGQRVRCNMDYIMYMGTVKEVCADHIIVDIPEVSDHCWFEEGLNMDCVYPEYNFEEENKK